MPAPIVHPRPATPGLLHSAFYRFLPLADPAAGAAALRRWAEGLAGSIIVATEGVSGAVAGTSAAVRDFESALMDGQGLLPAGAFRPSDFKRSACSTPPFGRLKVVVKPEIVALGLPPLTQPAPEAADPDADRLPPAEWRAMMARGDAVLLDNRNHFEFRLGHFRGAVDPGVDNFRDFARAMQQWAPAWRAAGRPLAMYCTGGIRCDKTAPWLRSLGLTVWQLDGGILNYFQQVEDPGRDWLGECFVFDNRIALDSALQPTATTAAQVYDPAQVDEAWRLQRALRLDAG
jgi:UPF0176 protein